MLYARHQDQALSLSGIRQALRGRERAVLLIITALGLWTLLACYASSSQPPGQWKLSMTIDVADDVAYVYLNGCKRFHHRVTANTTFAKSHAVTALPGQRVDLGSVNAGTIVTVRLFNDLGPAELRGEVVEPRSKRAVARLSRRLEEVSVGYAYVASFYGDGRPAPITGLCADGVFADALRRSEREIAEGAPALTFRPADAHDDRLLKAAAVTMIALLGLWLVPRTYAVRRRRRESKPMQERIRELMVLRTVTIFDRDNAVGTGFLLSTQAGGEVRIATCLHVLDEQDIDKQTGHLLVALHPDAAGQLGLERESQVASVHARDPSRDLAILSIRIPERTDSLAFFQWHDKLPISFAQVFATPLHGRVERSWRPGNWSGTWTTPDELREAVSASKNAFGGLTVPTIVLNLPALRGASGAPVCDVNGKLVAMIIAVSEKADLAYAVTAPELANWETRTGARSTL